MKHTYITALLELLSTSTDVEQLLTGFQQTLAARGHEQLFVPVLRGVLRTLEAARPETEVVVVRGEDVMKYRKAIEVTLQELGGDAESAVIRTDDSIIGGYIIEHNHTQLDKSYKSKLVDLYRSLTNK